MKRIKTRLAAFGLTLALAAGLMGSALAYTTPDFGDVPATHWAYPAIMEMADAGVIKGTGDGQFSPDLKVSPAMFLTLVGRVVFPGLATEGAATWYAPYVAESKAKGVLDGTAITDAGIEGEISRYDMAVVLVHAASLLEIQGTKAEATAITDYGDIPNKYTDPVLQVYGSGLITGDQNGNFNGAAAMTRAEAATVMDRLIALRDAQPTTPVEPEKPEETEPPVELSGKMVSIHVAGRAEASSSQYHINDPVEGMNLTLCYKDGTELAHTVSNAEGRYAFDVEIDAAYYSQTEECYYINATYVDAEGHKFSNIWNSIGHAYPLFNLLNADPCPVTVYSDDSYNLDF